MTFSIVGFLLAMLTIILTIYSLRIVGTQLAAIISRSITIVY